TTAPASSAAPPSRSTAVIPCIERMRDPIVPFRISAQTLYSARKECPRQTREIIMHLSKNSLAGLALLGALALASTGASSHDESKYHDWGGQWLRPKAVGINWDQDKRH